MYKIAIDLFKRYALQTVAGLSGIRAWLAKLAIKYLVRALDKLNTYLEEKHKAKKELEDYDKVINNPNSTAQEVSDAADDFLK